jgi:hypothetical protein
LRGGHPVNFVRLSRIDERDGLGTGNGAAQHNGQAARKRIVAMFAEVPPPQVGRRALGRESARLNSLTEEMIRLEEQADNLHDEGRKQLFLNQKDAIAFVIGTEVYGHLEMVMDRFEDVANEISAIIIENV